MTATETSQVILHGHTAPSGGDVRDNYGEQTDGPTISKKFKWRSGGKD